MERSMASAAEKDREGTPIKVDWKIIWKFDTNSKRPWKVKSHNSQHAKSSGHTMMMNEIFECLKGDVKYLPYGFLDLRILKTLSMFLINWIFGAKPLNSGNLKSSFKTSKAWATEELNIFNAKLTFIVCLWQTIWFMFKLFPRQTFFILQLKKPSKETPINNPLFTHGITSIYMGFCHFKKGFFL